MSESLRDQLLKSGLAAKFKAETKPAREQHKKPQPVKAARPQAQQPKKPASTPHEPNLAHAYALRAKQEKDERDQAQRDAEQLARENRERKQKLAGLLQGKALNSADADTPRHFPHGNKIRRVYCTAEQFAKLNRGDLAIVQLAGRYLLVERDVALQAQEISPQALVLLCDPNAPAEDDVPADIVW
ncbi:MAG: DUF2058 family protein [Proteobacteria bacterium]|uniref:DUF2058 domain-containing protein n=1 Tax=Rudaea sp. TaxID=2136325 RepID=UPI00321FFAC1|nr:DUF2058 family protein [Pseudomonadota bacterium]